jgi:hypothetical protein
MGVRHELPNGALLLTLSVLSRERIQAGTKAAISLPILREIIMVAVSKLPFDEEFYLTAYEDIREAYNSGVVSDLRSHFIEEGYFEGRFGARPDVHADFYLETYPDVAQAIANKQVTSALEHYMRAGAAEGRFANPEDQQILTNWLTLGGKM